MDALPPVAAAGPALTEPVSHVQLQTPSDADASAFSEAASGTQRALSIEAQPALPQDGLMRGIETRLDSLSHAMDASSSDVDAAQPDASVAAAAPAASPPAIVPTAASSSAGHAHGFDDSGFRQAFGSLQKSYGFSIEAQLASNGASSGTKVFNDLLKGQ